MTDRDVLSDAVKALRNSTDGQRFSSGLTRARIMNGLHKKQQRRVLKIGLVLPVLALFAGGSAWASVTENWPVVWDQVKAALHLSDAPAVAAPVLKAAANTPSQQAVDPITAPASTSVETPLATSEVMPAASAAGHSQSPAAVHSQSPAPRRAAPAASVPLPAEASTSSDALELALFREAHNWHFTKKQPPQAIAAYRAYMSRFPSGRLVPEAKYNIAINLLKLGDRDAARAALLPFAAGTYGSVRRQQAQQLLTALKE